MKPSLTLPSPPIKEAGTPRSCHLLWALLALTPPTHSKCPPALRYRQGAATAPTPCLVAGKKLVLKAGKSTPSPPHGRCSLLQPLAAQVGLSRAGTGRHRQAQAGCEQLQRGALPTRRVREGPLCPSL
uniref:Uncharacterized protein n=1 Tax=Crocodylus porosus TaxID=8502 RepID=A0A7M4G3G2_CROPO